jgi:hypothetical protein
VGEPGRGAGGEKAAGGWGGGDRVVSRPEHQHCVKHDFALLTTHTLSMQADAVAKLVAVTKGVPLVLCATAAAAVAAAVSGGHDGEADEEGEEGGALTLKVGKGEPRGGGGTKAPARARVAVKKGVADSGIYLDQPRRSDTCAAVRLLAMHSSTQSRSCEGCKRDY